MGYHRIINPKKEEEEEEEEEKHYKIHLKCGKCVLYNSRKSGRFQQVSWLLDGSVDHCEIII